MRLTEIAMFPDGINMQRGPAQTSVAAQSTGPAYLTDGRSGFQIDGMNSQQLRVAFKTGPLSTMRERFHILDAGSFNELFDTHQRFRFGSIQEFLSYLQRK